MEAFFRHLHRKQFDFTSPYRRNSISNSRQRKAAYPIKKAHKAHYVLMNVECSAAALAELEDAFRFSDAVLRHLTLARDEAITEASPLARDDSDRHERSSDEERADSIPASVE